MKVPILIFIIFCSICLGSVLIEVRSLSVVDLLKDKITATHPSKIIPSELRKVESAQIALTQQTTGWFTLRLYSNDDCSSDSMTAVYGTVTNRVLYSSLWEVYFVITCNSDQAYVTYSDHANISTPSTYSVTLNRCVNGAQMNCLTTTTNTLAPLPLPQSKELILYQYYEDSDCSSIVQFQGYSPNVCIRLTSDISTIYHGNQRTTYSPSSTCEGLGTTTSSQMNTCYDWVNLVNKQNSSDFEAGLVSLGGRYLHTSTLSFPTASPSVAPTASPGRFPPTTFSTLTATYPTLSHTQSAPTMPLTQRPSAAPFLFVQEYSLVFTVNQAFNLSFPSYDDCYRSVIYNAGMLELLNAAMRFTLDGSTASTIMARIQSFGLFIDNGNCGVWYNVNFPSILAMGYVTPDEAYRSLTQKITEAVDSGNYKVSWKQALISKNLANTAFSSLVTKNVFFTGSYISREVNSPRPSSSPSNPSVSPTSNPTSSSDRGYTLTTNGIIAITVIAVLLGGFLLFILIRHIQILRQKSAILPSQGPAPTATSNPQRRVELLPTPLLSAPRPALPALPSRRVNSAPSAPHNTFADEEHSGLPIAEATVVEELSLESVIRVDRHSRRQRTRYLPHAELVNNADGGAIMVEAVTDVQLV